MSDWIEWAGGECPVHPDTEVRYKLRDGYIPIDSYPARVVDWRHASLRSDVVAYQIVRPPLDFHTSGHPIRADERQEAGTHYRDMAVQPWQAMQAWMTPEQFVGYLRGAALKYLARAGSKGPTVEEYRKARHYLDKLIEVLEQ